MRYLGIDYGTKRVGVAFSDETERVAFPLSVFENDKDLFSKLQKIVQEKRVEKIVLGESKKMDGTPNLVMKEIEKFKDEIFKRLNVEVYYEPEFWSSFQAERWQGKSEKLDASAAAIILQSYLDRK